MILILPHRAIIQSNHFNHVVTIWHHCVIMVIEYSET